VVIAHIGQKLLIIPPIKTIMLRNFLSSGGQNNDKVNKTPIIVKTLPFIPAFTLIFFYQQALFYYM